MADVLFEYNYCIKILNLGKIDYVGFKDYDVNGNITKSCTVNMQFGYSYTVYSDHDMMDRIFRMLDREKLMLGSCKGTYYIINGFSLRGTDLDATDHTINICGHANHVTEIETKEKWPWLTY